ncbi:hypothetical protein Prubr_00520 [Polymorphospora rubra]|uniref:Uncharacterized protein n=1 Tax=Polymorphospora rubra TaxID=338584 RepID=A0A810MPL6_9ACTN|nr:hypothetical protein Prubr_00520 [Polymorphospora rubra]
MGVEVEYHVTRVGVAVDEVGEVVRGQSVPVRYSPAGVRGTWIGGRSNPTGAGAGRSSGAVKLGFGMGMWATSADKR